MARRHPFPIFAAAVVKMLPCGGTGYLLRIKMTLSIGSHAWLFSSPRPSLGYPL
jgi:hypothetical protein